MEHEEWLPWVNEQGEVIGKLSRREAHGGSFKLHPVVHLHLFDKAGRLYLQKRSEHKDVQPGKWDTAVGGHVDYGETIEVALARESFEELGLKVDVPVFIERYAFTSEVECELVHVYKMAYAGAINPSATEISEGRFWDIEEIEYKLDSGVFTPNFVQEFKRLKNVLINH